MMRIFNKKKVPGKIRFGGNDAASHLSEIPSIQQLEDVKTTMEAKMNQLEHLMTQQSKQMNFIIDTLDSKKDDPEFKLPIDCGSYVVSHGGTAWNVTGVSSLVPDPEYDYFPGLRWTHSLPNEPRNDKVISAIIPCYNEEGKELERTMRGLFRQVMPEGWRVEVVIVMDGMMAMDPSMAAYLETLFGVNFDANCGEQNPFAQLPNAQTVIVHPVDEEAAGTRRPALEGTTGGYSLVVKRENRRKANSQQWWLGPHASTIQCKYALATDCGTYFERTTAAKLMERLDGDISTHAVTGYQRTMPADLQGDGSWELCHHPFHFMLRNLQRFEFEVDNVSFMSSYDTVGTMFVIPGPCGLYRYSKLGSLTEGLMKQYFTLFSRSNKGLILGNVELVEDRIPGTLLTFPPKKSSKHENVMPSEGWPKTGLVHDAIFYMEAEKPLSRLVKQRRRWLNGTFATYLWMLQEGIITNSNQDPMTKVCSWFLVALGVFQGCVVRLFGPALLMAWMFRFGLFLPDLIEEPGRIFDPELSLWEVETEPGRLRDGILCSGIYFLLYVAFVVGHTPQAKPVQDECSIVRYSEPSRWKNDSQSAYRTCLFQSVLWINLVVVILYMINAIGIVWTLGWTETPLVVRVLIVFCFLPFLSGFLDGIARCNFSGLWNMIKAAPVALPLMIWFTIWLPAYATTRLSDLTWGNRERSSIDETETALKRAENGKKVARFLIGFNTTVALAVIVLMQFYGQTFPIFVMSYTLAVSATYAVSFLEIFYRMFVNGLGGSTSRVAPAKEDIGEPGSYAKMEESTKESSATPGSSKSSWWCLRGAGSDEQTTASDGSGSGSEEDANVVPMQPNEGGNAVRV